MGKKFSSIIFDLGGVLYNVDVQRSVDAFAKLGLKDFDDLYTLKSQSELFDKLETGHINTADFTKAIKKYGEDSMEDQSILDAWNALLMDMPAENVEILKQLKSRYKLYLLSNTNAIHLQHINEYMQREHGIDSLASLFDKAYFSFEMGMRKPDEVIYKAVLEDNSLEPSQALFIDDNEDNVKGARKAGIEAWLKKRETPLSEFLKDKNLL